MATDLTMACHAPATARRMAEAALRFRDALSDEQLAAATFPFAGDERYQWHYTPVERNGLKLQDMAPPQRDLAFALVASALSHRGQREVEQIIALEPILRETERIEGHVTHWIRDSGRYSFSIFGEPGGREPWAWRAGGHHLGLHFTVVDGEWVAPTPLFFGANPAEVRHGPSAGLRTLGQEEDLARALLGSLDTGQKAVAIVDPVAPDDILTRNYRRAEPGAAPSGLAFAALTGEQRGQLIELIRHYAARTGDELAANSWSGIERAGLDGVAFAWAGPEARGHGNYYAVKGPTFLIEYDNTQNGANHIHSVWRDFTGDWGEDLLASHYAADHRHGDDHHHS